jgi:hypothetical protein
MSRYPSAPFRKFVDNYGEPSMFLSNHDDEGIPIGASRRRNTAGDLESH